ncbi:MAG: hypothetical protein ACW98I_18800 [Candidatus Hodarchaeales archaeon]|jgi:hypothetical protein
MNFEFEIGQDEKHNVRFIYSKIWGTRSIKVDNQIVKRRILPFFVNFSGIILIVVFIYFQFLQWPNYQANPFEIYLLVLILLGFIDGVIARLPMTVIVGEKEQILVKVKWSCKPFPLFRSFKFKVYLNDCFFKTFEGGRVIEYVDEKIVFQKR